MNDILTVWTLDCKNFIFLKSKPEWNWSETLIYPSVSSALVTSKVTPAKKITSERSVRKKATSENCSHSHYRPAGQTWSVEYFVRGDSLERPVWTVGTPTRLLLPAPGASVGWPAGAFVVHTEASCTHSEADMFVLMAVLLFSPEI